jgi:hypothetical protein
MSIETKKIVCSPGEENRLINHYTQFGWTLAHRDEVYSQSQHITGANSYSLALTDDFAVGHTNVTSYTTTTNYVNLLFQRDSLLPHYSELKQLDQDCEALFNELDQTQNSASSRAQRSYSEGSRGYSISASVCFFIGMALLITSCASLANSSNIGGGIFTVTVALLLQVAGVVLFIFSIKNKKGAAASYSILNDPQFLKRLETIRSTIAAKEKEGGELMDEGKKAALGTGAIPLVAPVIDAVPVKEITETSSVETENTAASEEESPVEVPEETGAAAPIMEENPVEEVPTVHEIPAKGSLSTEEVKSSIYEAISKGKIAIASGKCELAHQHGRLSDEDYEEIKKEIEELKKV